MCGYDVLAGVSTHSHVRMPGRLSRGPLRGTWPLAALGEGVRYPERPELATVLQAVTPPGPEYRSPGHVVMAARLVSSAVSRSGHVITAATEEGPGLAIGELAILWWGY